MSKKKEEIIEDDDESTSEEQQIVTKVSKKKKAKEEVVDNDESTEEESDDESTAEEDNKESAKSGKTKQKDSSGGEDAEDESKSPEASEDESSEDKESEDDESTDDDEVEEVDVEDGEDDEIEEVEPSMSAVDEEPKKKTSKSKKSDASRKKGAKKKSEDKLEVDIEKAKTLSPRSDGDWFEGSVHFSVLEVKNVSKKPGAYYVQCFFDDAKKSVYSSEVIKKSVDFSKEQGRLFKLNSKPEKLIVKLYEKKLITAPAIGAASIEIEGLLDGYPSDAWHTLYKGKKKKEKGEIRLHVMYLPSAATTSSREVRPVEYFKYPLHELINKNRLDLFKRKLADDMLDMKIKNKEGNTGLIYACLKNEPEYVKAILATDVWDVKNETKTKAVTALHIAAWKCGKVVSSMVKAGFSVDAVDKTPDELTPLHYAAKGDNIEAIKALVKAKADINAKDANGNTPLVWALKEAAEDAVKVFVELGADIYVRNESDKTVWEISQGNEVEGPARRAFMQAMDIHDQREFNIRKKLPVKTVIKAEGLKQNWRECPQYAVTVEKKTKCSMFVHYPTTDRKLEWQRRCGIFIVKSEEGEHNEPTFQRNGAGLASQTPYDGELDPDDVYSIIPYSKSSDISGDFNIIIYTEKGKPIPEYEPLVPWKYVTNAESKWSKRRGTAGGCQNHKTWTSNPHFEVTLPKDPQCKFCVMLSQTSGDVMSTADFQIVPYSINIGFYLYDRGVAKLLTAPEAFLGSRDTFTHLSLDTSKRNHIVVVPCAFNPGDESKFTVTVFCDGETSISMRKKK